LNSYVFIINAVPSPSNNDCANLAGANVHIWVISGDREKAKIEALDYVSSYLWDVVSVEREFEIWPEQIPVLPEREATLYQRALQHRIAADFLAYPKPKADPDVSPTT